MKVLRLLLFPFSIVYGLIVTIRNLLFDWKILRSVKFNVPVISIGNLNTGGTGKTPHTEYIIQLLEQKDIAVLSRGYGRKTKGNILATKESSPFEIGDEPYQIKQKFPEITLMVDEKRVRGIEKLQSKNSTLQAVLLDDAFQHRAVQPDLSILLTSYKKLYINDFMLPTGNLREPIIGCNRADIIIVTKTPEQLSPQEQKELKQTLKVKTHQRIYFSYLQYGKIKAVYPNLEDSSKNISWSNIQHIFLLTGIADASFLINYLSTKATITKHHQFPDHYQFNKNDIQKVIEDFTAKDLQDKIILTTEKDAVRLLNPVFKDILSNLPIFFIPIEVKFHNTGFDEEIKKQVL